MGHLGASFLRRSTCVEGMVCRKRRVICLLQGTGTASGRPGIFLKDSTEDAVTISVDSLFQNRTDRIVKAYWRRQVHHLCFWNL